MKSSRSKRHARALGAAMAGILAGSSLALAHGAQAGTQGQSLRRHDPIQKQIAADEEGDEPNGCNGPNGCGGEGEGDSGQGS